MKCNAFRNVLLCAFEIFTELSQLGSLQCDPANKHNVIVILVFLVKTRITPNSIFKRPHLTNASLVILCATTSSIGMSSAESSRQRCPTLQVSFARGKCWLQIRGSLRSNGPIQT